jgi:hypothetical protein
MVKNLNAFKIFKENHFQKIDLTFKYAPSAFHRHLYRNNCTRLRKALLIRKMIFFCHTTILCTYARETLLRAEYVSTYIIWSHSCCACRTAEELCMYIYFMFTNRPQLTSKRQFISVLITYQIMTSKSYFLMRHSCRVTRLGEFWPIA